MADPLKVYVDTCVFGGAFDVEFEAPTTRFFRQVEEGRFRLVLSTLTRQEIERAPDRVRSLFFQFLEGADLAEVSPEAINLAGEYIQSGVVSRKHFEDALHVAVATVSECDAIVSWNFKAIVHFERIPAYARVNAARGYRTPHIHSPPEVINYGKDL